MKEFFEGVKKRKPFLKKVTTRTIESNKSLFESIFGKEAIVVVSLDKGRHVIAYKDGRLHDLYSGRPRNVNWIIPIKRKKVGR